LRRFRDRYANAFDELRRLVETRGTRHAEAFCHALKGVSGNIGAVELHARITAIDALLRENYQPDNALLDEAEALLRRTMAEIDVLVRARPEAAPAAQQPLDNEARKDLLDRLADALAYDLGAAEPLLMELRAGMTGTAFAGAVEELYDRIDVFDIDGALLLLDDLRGSAPPESPPR
jgi:two-component system, sensor histidine kinase and response regulator